MKFHFCLRNDVGYEVHACRGRPLGQWATMHAAVLGHSPTNWQSSLPMKTRIRRVSGDPVQHCFLFKRGVRGGGSPPLFSYLNMLFNDALVNIGNFFNLYYISYMKKKPLKSVQGPYVACLLAVYNRFRETLNHSLRVLLCIA